MLAEAAMLEDMRNNNGQERYYREALDEAPLVIDCTEIDTISLRVPQGTSARPVMDTFERVSRWAEARGQPPLA